MFFIFFLNAVLIVRGRGQRPAEDLQAETADTLLVRWRSPVHSSLNVTFKRLNDHSSLSNPPNWSKLKRLNDNSSLSNRPNWSQFKRLNDDHSLSNRPNWSPLDGPTDTLTCLLKSAGICREPEKIICRAVGNGSLIHGEGGSH